MKKQRLEKFSDFLNENWKDDLANSLSDRKNTMPIYARDAADIIANSDMNIEFKSITIKAIIDFMKKFDPNFSIPYHTIQKSMPKD